MFLWDNNETLPCLLSGLLLLYRPLKKRQMSNRANISVFL